MSSSLYDLAFKDLEQAIQTIQYINKYMGKYFRIPSNEDDARALFSENEVIYYLIKYIDTVLVNSLEETIKIQGDFVNYIKGSLDTTEGDQIEIQEARLKSDIDKYNNIRELVKDLKIYIYKINSSRK